MTFLLFFILFSHSFSNSLEENKLALIKEYLEEDEMKLALSSADSIDDINSRREAKFLIASYLKNKGYLTKAEKILEALVKSKGNKYNESLFLLGSINFLNNNYKDAIYFLNRYLSYTKKNDKSLNAVYYYLAVSNEKLNSIKKAKVYFDKVLSFNDLYFVESLISILHIVKNRDSFNFYVNKAVNDVIARKNLHELDLLLEYFVNSGNREIALKVLSKNPFGELYSSEKKIKIYSDARNYEDALKVLETSTLPESKKIYLSNFLNFNLKNYREVVASSRGLQDDYSLLRLALSYMYLEDFSNAKEIFIRLKNSSLKREVYHFLIKLMVLSEDIDNEILEEFREISFEESDRKAFIEALNLSLNRDVDTLLLIKELYARDNSLQAIRTIIDILFKIGELDLVDQYDDNLSKSEASLYKALARLNRNQDATQYLEESMKDPKYRERSIYLIVDSLISLNKSKQAIKYIDLYLSEKHQKYRDELIEKKANLHYKMKEYKKALSSYRMLPAPISTFRIATLNFNLGRLKKASGLYLKVLKGNDDDLKNQSLFSLFQIAYSKGNYKKAKFYLEKVVRDKKFFYKEALYSLGIVNMDLGNYSEALVNFKDFFSNNTSRVDNWIEYILEFLSNNRVPIEKEFISFAKELDYSKTVLVNSRIALRKGDIKAIDDLESLINSNLKNDALKILINHYLSFEEFNKAEYYLSKVSIDDNIEDFITFVEAVLKMRKSEYNSAIESFNILKLKNSDFRDRIYLELAECYKMKNDEGSYIRVLKEFVNNFSNSKYIVKALNKIVTFYLKSGNKEEASKYCVLLKGVNNEAAEKFVDAFNF